MPVSIGVQWPSREKATGCKRGDLDLVFCEACGFIWNGAFQADKLEYSQRYDNSLDYSPVFQEYAESLAERLIATYGLHDKRVVEIGCGKGHFLALLCERGNNAGVGFDPSFEGERAESAAADRIEYYQDFYGEAYTGHRGDLVCCRHVFEHIEAPGSFLDTVRRTIDGDRETVVYFEVPNARFILEELSVWDVIYEHCNYFSRESLGCAFRRAGFEVIRLEESYGGQFLALEARLAPETAQGAEGVPFMEDTGDLARRVGEFASHVEARSREWEARLEGCRREGQKVVVWGGGAKTVSFVNMLPNGDLISDVVDINPNKQGLFIPGGGQEIVAPQSLRESRPDLVILMNPIYRQEVGDHLDRLGIATELVAC
jgi:SAM-dependent methyltransferase